MDVYYDPFEDFKKEVVDKDVDDKVVMTSFLIAKGLAIEDQLKNAVKLLKENRPHLLSSIF